MKNGTTEQALRSERERWEAGTKALAQLVADEGDDFSDLATNALVPPLTADHGWRCECGVCDQTRLDEWSDR